VQVELEAFQEPPSAVHAALVMDAVRKQRPVLGFGRVQPDGQLGAEFALSL
jgi:hypothetical protein